MNVTLNITSVPDQEAFLVDATTVTPTSPSVDRGLGAARIGADLGVFRTG